LAGRIRHPGRVIPRAAGLAPGLTSGVRLKSVIRYTDLPAWARPSNLSPVVAFGTAGRNPRGTGRNRFSPGVDECLTQAKGRSGGNANNHVREIDMIKNKSGLMQTAWIAVALVSVAGCGTGDIENPLSASASASAITQGGSHAGRQNRLFVMKSGMAPEMAVEFRHFDAYEQYRGMFDRASGGIDEASVLLGKRAAGFACSDNGFVK